MLAVSSATSITYTLIVLLIIKKKFPSQTEPIFYKTNVCFKRIKKIEVSLS